MLHVKNPGTPSFHKLTTKMLHAGITRAQAQLRMLAARQHFLALRGATVLVQRVARKAREEKKARLERAAVRDARIREAAAIKLQAMWRGVMCRCR